MVTLDSINIRRSLVGPTRFIVTVFSTRNVDELKTTFRELGIPYSGDVYFSEEDGKWCSSWRGVPVESEVPGIIHQLLPLLDPTAISF